MPRPSSAKHSLNNLQQENLQAGNPSKSNSNQITLFTKFSNLKLLTGSLLLLFLVACLGETSNIGGNGGDEPPSVDECEADNTIEGCPSYVPPIVDECEADNTIEGCPGYVPPIVDECEADNTIEGCPGYVPPIVDECEADNTIEGCPGYVPPIVDECEADNTIEGCPGYVPPIVDECEADNTIEGCPGYVAPIRNSYLTEDKLTATGGVPNYLIRPNYATPGSTKSDAGAGHNINEVFYGTIAGIGIKYTPQSLGTFIEATTDADKKDDDKNNIIKISTGKDDETASDNYYYSHIGDKQFTQFLPAINKLEILVLNSKPVTLDEPNNVLFRSSDIHSNMPDAYNKLKDFVMLAKDYTFKGFALVGFSNYVISQQNYDINETDLYPGKFTLTFNSFLDGTFITTSTNNYFSMKITLDQEAAEVPTPTAIGVLPQVAAKPAVKTIEIKNFHFLTNQPDSDKFRSYPGQTTWSYYIGNTFLAFSENSAKDKIEQIAGIFLLSKSGDNHRKYMRIAFASNEVCDSDPIRAGDAACPRVQLTE